jgi:DNA sulfur modification protein DndD
LKIEKVSVANFGVLAHLELDLSDKSGDLVFLNGSNGRGKTTFQSALRWLFYGQEPSESEKFLSNYAFQSALSGDAITVRVSAEVAMDGEGSYASVTRVQTFVKNQDGKPSRVGYPTLEVKSRNSKVTPFTDMIPKPELWLEKYFPPRLINFFLFDGEMMQDFFEKNVKKSIEDAVKEIAGVDLFDSARINLFNVKETLNRKISKLSGSKAEQLNIEVEAQQKVVDAISADLKRETENLANYKSRKQVVLSEIAKFDGLGDAPRRLEQIEIELEENTKAFLEANREFESELLKVGINSLFLPTFDELEKQLIQAEADDCLPPKFEPARIKQLLDDEECICGSPLHIGESKRKKLEGMIEAFSVASDVGKKLELTRRGFEQVVLTVKGDWRYAQEKNGAIPRYEEKIRLLNEEKNRILVRLEGQSLESIQVLTQEQRDLDAFVEGTVRAVTSFGLQLQTAQMALKRLQDDFENASRGNAEADLLKVQAKWATELSAAASEIHSLAIRQVRERLQESVSKSFAKVKKGKFETIITENFQVLTLTPDGTELPLSQGQKMMKAYIFSIALREVINLGFPLIVDTPFGRLDESNRNELATMLSSFLLDEKSKLSRQVIFLMHDGEYTPYTRKHFQGAHPKEVYFAFDKGSEDLKSSLGEGIDPDWLKISAWQDWAKGNIK